MNIWLKIQIFPSLFVVSDIFFMLVFISLSSIILMVFIPESSFKYINFPFFRLSLIIHLHDLTWIWLTIFSFTWTPMMIIDIILIITHSFELILTLILILYLVKYLENISVHLLQLPISVLFVYSLWSIQKFLIRLQLRWNLVSKW